MKRTRIILAASVTLIGLVLVGCGPETSRTFSSDELDKMADDRLKGIADDTADADSFKKYFEHHSATPTIIMPKELGPWWAVKPAGDGVTVHFTHIPNQLQAGATVESRLASERNWMKASIELSRQVLRHFEHRKVRSITIALFTQLTGDTKYTEMFRRRRPIGPTWTRPSAPRTPAPSSTLARQRSQSCGRWRSIDTRSWNTAPNSGRLVDRGYGSVRRAPLEPKSHFFWRGKDLRLRPVGPAACALRKGARRSNADQSSLSTTSNAKFWSPI